MKTIHKHHFHYDESERAKRQNPEELLDAIGLKEGMVFTDIGSSNGFFAVPAAKIVGGKGRVYALDTNAEAIGKLKEKAVGEGLNNITAEVGEAEETIFCKGCADIIFYGMVLHDFYDPSKVLQNARDMLKPEGRLVSFDWKKEETEMGPPFSIRLSEEEASSLIKKAGFGIKEIKSLPPYFYLITAGLE